ncbi:Mss4-like protein [Lasiosphaeria hispida]|uniref:Mss4-like protein n=1 Tax=Lasiosphaeria hispida TaxID=260671 RepID=A0AAJ0HB72_9PEZI|nr:Mss4-like protein [Lasiosphaeria hispida]
MPSSNPEHKSSDGNEPRQQQAGSSTDREEDQWKYRPPYSIRNNPDDFPVKWRGKCHCGAVEYQLSRDKPLASKYCHCTTCQRLHGAPFQWAAIFHKTDINFIKGHHDLGWYDSANKSTTHHLPCKVQCAFCRTPIMDEGRNMILLFPTLIEGIDTPKGREAFAAQNHMFYPQRVVDIKDGLPKFKGLSNNHPLIDEDTGEEMVPDSEPERESKKPKREHK